MSQLRECLVDLKTVDETIAKQAMADLARELNDSTTTVVSDYEGRKTRVITGLSRLGYGVKIVDGEVRIVGDPYMKHMSLEEFRKRFVQRYTAVAMSVTLSRLGFITNETKSGKNYVIVGTRV
jgi:CMP-2-keto-3-deoxyoctulosonic acid synthetase